jgi:outer membrane protein W
MNKSLLSASLVALALAAPAAHAHQAGDIILRAGAITTAPNETAATSSSTAPRCRAPRRPWTATPSWA